MNTDNEGNTTQLDVTHIRMTCERGSIETNVTIDHAQMMLNFASLVAKDARTDKDLVEFILDQIDGRATYEEAVLAKAHPGYAEDVANKVAIFVLGLLIKRPELTESVNAALSAGGHTIDVQLSSANALVQIDGHLLRCKTNFMIAGDAGLTAALH